MLPREAVDEFKEIYEKRYNVTLTYDEAVEMAERMFNLYLVLLRPDDTGNAKGGEYNYGNNKNRAGEPCRSGSSEESSGDHNGQSDARDGRG